MKIWDYFILNSKKNIIQKAEQILKEGVNLTGKVNISKGKRFKGGDVMKYGTEEQKAAWMKYQKEEEERKKITEEKRAELKPIDNAINSLLRNNLYVEPRGQQDRNKMRKLNALGKAEEKRLQGLLEQIQIKHDNRYGKPYSPVDKTPIGKPLTASPVISKSNTEKNNIDTKVSSVTPNIKAFFFIWKFLLSF